MPLEKQTVIDKIEVLENNSIQVRTATRILEDGSVLSESLHRHVVEQGADLNGEDPRVVAIAKAVWAS